MIIFMGLLVAIPSYSATGNYPVIGYGIIPSLSNYNINGVLNVQAYGAKCDGSTDDSSIIQTAINSGAGNIITANTGSICIISVPLNLPSNTQLSGNWTLSRPTGNSGPLLQTNNGSQTCGTLITNVRIIGLTLDGKATARVTSDIIDLFCTTKSYVEWNNIQNAEVGGINVINSTNSQIDHNYVFKAFGDCIYDQGSGGDNNHYEHNTCDAGGVATDGGFSANLNSGHTIWSDNTVKNLTGVSFGMEAAGAHDVTIVHNHIESGYGQHGIRILQNLAVDSYNIIIDGNIIASPTTAGTYCIDDGFENQGHHNNPTLIRGNICIANNTGDVRGIYVGGFNKQIEGNYVYAPNSLGGCIFIDAGAGVLNTSQVNIYGNILNSCSIGIFGASNGNFTNITEGPQFYEGVTTESNAIAGALSSFYDTYISSEARIGASSAQWGFGTFGSTTDWSLHDVTNGKQPITVKANAPSFSLAINADGSLLNTKGSGTTPNTIANLAICNSGNEGLIARQTNSAAACSSGSIATTTGTTHCFIGCNGTNWVQFGF